MALIGTCGNCGGPVETPDAWLGILPPPAACQSCGSTPKKSYEPYGPVLPMNPAPRYTR